MIVQAIVLRSFAVVVEQHLAQALSRWAPQPSLPTTRGGVECGVDSAIFGPTDVPVRRVRHLGRDDSGRAAIGGIRVAPAASETRLRDARRVPSPPGEEARQGPRA